MLFCYFAAAILSLEQKAEVASTGIVTKVTDFGFDEGATFDIYMESTYSAKVRFVIIKQDIYDSTYSSKKTCGNISKIDGVLFSNPIIKGLYFNWKGTIEEKGIYDILVINCADGDTMYNLRMNMHNKFTNLDTRFMYHSFAYGGLSFIHLVIGTIWIILELIKHCRTGYTFIAFSILPIIRAVQLGMDCMYWNELNITGKVRKTMQWECYVIYTLYYMMFNLSIMITFSGVLSFRKTLSQREKLEIIPNCIANAVFITVMLNVKDQTIKKVMIGLFIATQLWLAKLLFIYLDTYHKMFVNYECDYKTRDKSKGLLQLMTATIILYSGFSFLEVVSIFLNYHVLVPLMLNELYGLLIEIGQMSFFLFNTYDSEKTDISLKSDMDTYEAIA